MWEELREGSLLGSDRFIERMKPRLAKASLDPNVLRRERDAARPSLEALFSDGTDRRARNQRICNAVRDRHDMLQEVGDHIGLHFPTIEIIAKCVSEERADSRMEAGPLLLTGQRRIHRLNKKVVVIVHQAVRVTEPGESIHYLGEDLKKHRPIRVIEEDVLSGVPA